MSIPLQGVSGAQWPRRDWAGVRAQAERAELQRDEPTAADRQAAAKPQDYATDALRLAALRRDAAATATASTAKTHTAADDTEIATRTWLVR